jgi:SAM-dependent methyltransferase
VAGRSDTIWRNEWVVKRFLEGVRGGIPYANDQLEVMLRLLAASHRPIERFLDLGCGSGLLAIALLTQYPDARATLVDVSEPMMDAARDLLGENSVLPHFVLADLADPGWASTVARDAPFDAIVSGFAIHHLEDQRKRELYGEILPLLAPGAWFINLEHVASTTPWVHALFDDAMIESLASYQTAAGSGRSREQVAHEYHERPDESENRLVPVDVQMAWLREVGFADVDCYFKYFELAVFGGRRPL